MERRGFVREGRNGVTTDYVKRKKKKKVVFFYFLIAIKSRTRTWTDLCAAESLKASTREPLLPSLAFSAPSKVLRRQTKSRPHRPASQKQEKGIYQRRMGIT